MRRSPGERSDSNSFWTAWRCLEEATKSRSPYLRLSGACRALEQWRLTAAPPTSLAGILPADAAAEILSASSITSARGTLLSVVSSRLLHVHDDRLEVGHLLDRAIAADPTAAALLAGAPAKGNVRFPVVG